MDILEFQNKLNEIKTLALKNQKRVSAELVEKFFGKEGMGGGKLEKVFDYLESQGIRVEGYEQTPKGKEECQRETDRVPLKPEEEEYLKEYQEAFALERDGDRKALLEDYFAGQAGAKDGLICLYQKEIIQAARELNQEEVFFGDLLQEGNMGFLAALERMKEEAAMTGGAMEALHETLCREIRSTIRLFLEEQTQQKKEDDFLVERVRTLEQKLKELTGDDKDIKYSVEELALFLDMDVEEIRSVLRLTGEDN